MHELVEAIEALADVPTARLERLLAEHVDVCAYRLDAWRLGLVHERLLALRGDSDGAAPPPGGIHLGAFGWLEDVRPQERRLSPAEVPEGLSPAFADGEGRQPLMAEAANGGYVHAPSLNHAGTAAVLRSGHMAGVERGDPGALAVDLTSERVRLALGVLEGIRNSNTNGSSWPATRRIAGCSSSARFPDPMPPPRGAGAGGRTGPAAAGMDRMPLPRVGVGELARLAHVSRGYLKRLFRTAFGLSAAAALERARCSRAESLLLRTDLAVAVIGAQCGFADASHFSRRFASIHGISPRAYRAAVTASPSVLDHPGVRRLTHLLWG